SGAVVLIFFRIRHGRLRSRTCSFRHEFTPCVFLGRDRRALVTKLCRRVSGVAGASQSIYDNVYILGFRLSAALAIAPRRSKSGQGGWDSAGDPGQSLEPGSSASTLDGDRAAAFALVRWCDTAVSPVVADLALRRVAVCASRDRLGNEAISLARA